MLINKAILFSKIIIFTIKIIICKTILHSILWTKFQVNQIIFISTVNNIKIITVIFNNE